MDAVEAAESLTSTIADKQENRTKTNNSNNRETTWCTHSFFCAHLLTHHSLRLQCLLHNVHKSCWGQYFRSLSTLSSASICGSSGTLEADVKLTNKPSYIISKTKTQCIYGISLIYTSSFPHTHTVAVAVCVCVCSTLTVRRPEAVKIC